MAARKTAATGTTAQIDTAVAAGNETVEKMMKAGQDAMEMLNLDKTVEMAREQVEKAQKAMFGNYEQFAEMNKATFDAYVTSLNLMTKGVEAFGKEVADFTKKSMETSSENGKSLMACKTVNEAFDLQNEIARTSIDTMVAETAKLTEMSLKTANDVFSPIADQANVTITKMFKAPAA